MKTKTAAGKTVAKERKLQLHIDDPQFLFPYFFCKTMTAAVREDEQTEKSKYRTAIVSYYKRQFANDLHQIQSNAGINTFSENALDALSFNEIEIAAKALFDLLRVIEKLSFVATHNKNWLAYAFSANHAALVSDIFVFGREAEGILTKIDVICKKNEIAYYSRELKAYPARLFFRKKTSFSPANKAFPPSTFASLLARTNWSAEEIFTVQEVFPDLRIDPGYTYDLLIKKRREKHIEWSQKKDERIYKIISPELIDANSFLFGQVTKLFFKRTETEHAVSVLEGALVGTDVVVSLQDVKDTLHQIDVESIHIEKRVRIAHILRSFSFWFALMVFAINVWGLISLAFLWDMDQRDPVWPFLLLWLVPMAALSIAAGTLGSFDEGWRLLHSAPRGLSTTILLIGAGALFTGGYYGECWVANYSNADGAPLLAVIFGFIPVFLFWSMLYSKEHLKWNKARRRYKRKPGKVFFCSWLGPCFTMISVAFSIVLGATLAEFGMTFAVLLLCLEIAWTFLLIRPLFNIDKSTWSENKYQW